MTIEFLHLKIYQIMHNYYSISIRIKYNKEITTVLYKYISAKSVIIKSTRCTLMGVLLWHKLGYNYSWKSSITLPMFIRNTFLKDVLSYSGSIHEGKDE